MQEPTSFLRNGVSLVHTQIRFISAMMLHWQHCGGRPGLILNFVDLMIRYTDFGYVMQGGDPFQTEAFFQDLLHNATVNEVDIRRFDVRYVNGKRCVPKSTKGLS